MTPLNQIKPLSLRANFSWTFMGNAVYAASQWGMLVVLARLGTPEMVGQFALGLAVTAPVMLFFNLQLRAIQATDAKQEYTFGDYLGLRLVTSTVAYLVIVGIVIVSGYSGETGVVILLVGLAKTFESLSDVIYGLLQQRERMDRISKSLMIKGPASLVALAIGVFVTGNLIGGVVGMIVVWGLLFLFYDWSSAGRLIEVPALLCPRWNLRRLQQLLWLSLPLGFVAMLISLNTNIPRIFIERYLGEAHLGIFAAMTYLIVAGNTIVGALGQSASPRLATYYTEGRRSAYLHLLGKLALISGALGAVGIAVALLAGELLLGLLYGSEYAAYTDVFVWVMVGGALAYTASSLGYAMTTLRQFKSQAMLNVAFTFVILCSSAWLIPVYGLLGAAFATVILFVIQILLNGLFVYAALQRLNR